MNSSVGLHGMAMIFRKVKRSRWRIPLVGHVLLTLLAAFGGSSAVAQQRARLVDGGNRTGQLTGTSPATLGFATGPAEPASKNETIALTEIRQITFGARPRLVSGMFPTRRIDFRGGESLHAEVEAVDATTVGVSVFGATASPIPRAALGRLLQSAGERSLEYEDFENRPTLFDGVRLSPAQHRSGRQSLSRRPGDNPTSIAIGRKIPSGRIELNFYDTGAVERSQEWFVEIDLGTRDQTDDASILSGMERAGVPVHGIGR